LRAPLPERDFANVVITNALSIEFLPMYVFVAGRPEKKSFGKRKKRRNIIGCRRIRHSNIKVNIRV